MSKEVAVAQPKSVIMDMAIRYGMEKDQFEQVVRQTCMPSNVAVSPAEFAAFVLVAKELGLNPIAKEIFAYPKKGGGIQAIVSIDGWITLINQHPQFDGMDFLAINDDKAELVAMQCSMWRKDRSRPVVIVERLDECKRNTDPWKQMPHRMLRHKAAIQCARYVIGISGVMDEDEFERMEEMTLPQTSGVVSRIGKDERTRAGFDSRVIENEISGEQVPDELVPAVKNMIEPERVDEPEVAHDEEAHAKEATIDSDHQNRGGDDGDPGPEAGPDIEAREEGEAQPENASVTPEEREFLKRYNLALNRATKPESIISIREQFAKQDENKMPLSAEATRRSKAVYGLHHERWNNGLKATDAFTQIMAIINA